MRKTQWFVIIVAAVAVFCLYAFGRRVSDKKVTPAATSAVQPNSTGQQVPAANFDEVLSKAKQGLDPATQMHISNLENSVTRGEVRKQQLSAYRSLASLWDSLGHIPISAHYLGQAAKLEKSEKSLTFAANLFLIHQQHTEDPAIRTWQLNEAKQLLEQAVSLDPNNDTINVALAKSEVASGNVMQGVQRLLKIVKSDPDNIGANMELGRLSITSGQYVKAIERLEKVVSQQPKNAEALYFLAEAYKNTGKTKKAISLFERCKKLVNDPAFSKEIDNYINSFNK